MKEALEKPVVIEQQIDKEKRSELKHLATHRKIKGLKIWQYDLISEEVKIAETETVLDFTHAKEGITKTKIVIKPHHLYCQALNLKNAAKKFSKQLGLVNYKIEKA